MTTPRSVPILLPAALLVALTCAPAPGQQRDSRWEVAAVPAVNYDADEGFGYGAIAELYNVAPTEPGPYRFTLQPTVFLTTGGRKDFTLFFDSPRLLPGGWRVDAFLGSEQQLASPYYGLGNDVEVDPAMEKDPENPYFYRFGRTRRQLSANLQHGIGGLPLRALFGVGLVHNRIDAVPRDSGTTFLARELAGGAVPGGYSNYLRGGLVWDTRDREVGPSRGSWSELLVQRVDRALGSEASYTRWTATDRRYLPLGSSRLVFANRLLVQGVQGDAPFYDLHQVQNSFKQQEGLGGAKTIRGMPKNRYVGRGLFLWNAELRWRAAEFGMMGKPSHLTVTGFADSGRVWAGAPEPASLLTGLHHGMGGGLRLGMGENFVVALDVGHSTEAAAPFYIGLGYLY